MNRVATTIASGDSNGPLKARVNPALLHARSRCQHDETNQNPAEPETLEVRAAHARIYISTRSSAKRQVFLAFVLSNYVTIGLEKLDRDKLTPLLRLKYNNSIADAVADLGRPEEIQKAFTGFQRFLYT